MNPKPQTSEGSDRPGRPAPRARASRPSRAAEVQDAVKELILERRLTAGDPLPTEFELMEELGISRNSIREALKALQAIGIVEIRHGFGMFVGRMSLSGLVDELAFHTRITLANGRNDLGRLIEIREVLECGLLEKLLDQHPNADHADVAEVITQMERDAQVGEVLPETDKRFHELLYAPLQNPLVGQLLGAFWDVYYELRDELGPAGETPADTVRKHLEIYRAVIAKDSARATAAMVAHFDGVRSRVHNSTG